MASTTHQTLVLLCIITIITYTYHVASIPIKRSATVNCYGPGCEIDLNIHDNSNNTQQVETISGSVTLPQDKDLLQNIAYTQQNMTASLQQLTTLLQDLPSLFSNMVEIQQGVHQQLINMTDLLQSFDTLNFPLTTMTPDGPTALPSICSSDLSTGQHTILPINNELGAFDVYCDMDTEGGGWIIFQHRFDGSVRFDRNWVDYERGFGSLDGEFWLGLNKLHVLTSRNRWKLWVDLEDFYGSHAYATYNNFQVGNIWTFYRLTLGRYSGTAGDGMMNANILDGMSFTTRDQDHDRLDEGNCGLDLHSGWWHRYCTNANLNGLYLGEGRRSTTGMTWSPWRQTKALKKSEMKIKLVG